MPPPIRHMFVIVLENKPFEETFGPNSPAPYLAHELAGKGVLLTNYYGIGHSSLDNYLALISGQAPNPDTQADCGTLLDFELSQPNLDANGQAIGGGCVYPTIVKTLPDQLEAVGFTWRGYMEDLGKDPKRDAQASCHIVVGALDHTNQATPGDQYADKHNPFIYFHSIIDNPARCDQHVVNLDALPKDLEKVETTPNFAFITPNSCHDGHDAPCKNGEQGGLVSADQFLRTWVPRIVASPAFQQDGLLVVTFDEGTDSTACCDERGLPGGPQPGKNGPGGGRIGAVLVSPFVTPGTISKVDYNHYSLLRSIEDFFRLPHLGYAGMPGLAPFGTDVFSR